MRVYCAVILACCGVINGQTKFTEVITNYDMNTVQCSTETHSCDQDEICEKICFWDFNDDVYIGCKVTCVKSPEKIAQFGLSLPKGMSKPPLNRDAGNPNQSKRVDFFDAEVPKAPNVPSIPNIPVEKRKPPNNFVEFDSGPSNFAQQFPQKPTLAEWSNQGWNPWPDYVDNIYEPQQPVNAQNAFPEAGEGFGNNNFRPGFGRPSAKPAPPIRNAVNQIHPRQRPRPPPVTTPNTPSQCPPARVCGTFCAVSINGEGCQTCVCFNPPSPNRTASESRSSSTLTPTRRPSTQGTTTQRSNQRRKPVYTDCISDYQCPKDEICSDSRCTKIAFTEISSTRSRSASSSPKPSIKLEALPGPKVEPPGTRTSLKPTRDYRNHHIVTTDQNNKALIRTDCLGDEDCTTGFVCCSKEFCDRTGSCASTQICLVHC